MVICLVIVALNVITTGDFMMLSVTPSSLQLVFYVEEGQTDSRLKWALIQSQEVFPVT